MKRVLSVAFLKLVLVLLIGLNNPAYAEGKLAMYLDPCEVNYSFNHKDGMWYWHFDFILANTGSRTIEVLAISAINESKCEAYGKDFCEHSDNGYFPQFRTWFKDCYVDGKLLIPPGKTCTSKWWSRSNSKEYDRPGVYFGWYKDILDGREKVVGSSQLVLMGDKDSYVRTSIGLINTRDMCDLCTAELPVPSPDPGPCPNPAPNPDPAPNPEPDYTGSVKVIIKPHGAISDGAKWSLRESPYTGIKLESGQIIHGIATEKWPPKAYTIHFESIDGWATPLDARVFIENGQLTTYEAEYKIDPTAIKDPILAHESCVGISGDFYVFDLEKMPEEDISDHELNSLIRQTQNIAYGIFKDLLPSPEGIIIGALTGAKVTLIDSTLRTLQFANFSAQTTFEILNADGEVSPDDPIINITKGEAFLPIIYLKTNKAGNSQQIEIDIKQRKLVEPVLESFSLSTNGRLSRLKGTHLYMLIPRTTSVSLSSKGWDYLKSPTGMEGITMTTGDEYIIKLKTSITEPALGKNKRLLKINDVYVPDIKINDSDGPLKLKVGTPLSLQIGLKTSNKVIEADWWIAAITPYGNYYYSFECVNEGGCWVYAPKNIEPTAQGAIMNDIPLFELDTLKNLTAGDYYFYFGADTKMNGVIDNEYLYLDYVNVKVVD